MKQKLEAGQIVVVRACCPRLSQSFRAACEAALGLGEARRMGTFRRAGDRMRYATAHGLLRLASGRILGREPPTLVMAETERGKPYWADAPGLAFNISHSGDWVYVAFACGREVGVDVQVPQPAIDPVGIARIAMSDAEAAGLAMVPDADDRLRAFHLTWTLREAAVKASGDGVFGGLRSFSVWPPPAPGAWIRRELRGGDPLWLRVLDETRDHVAAVAVIGGAEGPALALAFSEEMDFVSQVMQNSIGWKGPANCGA